MLSNSVVTFSAFSLFISLAASIRYDPQLVNWNLNQNQTATQATDYSGAWDNHEYQPSPDNWRFPFYTLFLDRFVNGDPTNDDANNTAWEHDLRGTQLRNGGDVKGLQDTLDYLAGMGIKGLYLAGSPMINFPWGADGYSPLDFSLLDAHHGEIDAWRSCIDEIHKRGMYIVLDNTMSTMADLIGFENFLNVSAPFRYGEHNALWKSERQYFDFDFGNTELEKCDVSYPRFYNDSGFQVFDNGTQDLNGCRDSEFNQYGDIQAFGFYPEWQRQISKFSSVQDRLREWKPSVLEKISSFACLQISMLDIDGLRIDKGIQITVDAQAQFASNVRECAQKVNKKNFLMGAELVGGNAFNAIYMGRGKELPMENLDVSQVITQGYDKTSDSDFIRMKGQNAVDASVFNYSVFRALTRFLGLDGQLAATFDTPVDFIEAWRFFVATQDMNNVNTGKFDPRHMYGTQNQDQFRWPGVTNGTERQLLGNFITTLLMPGAPILEWGEEQAFYVLDSTAGNYLYGRQAMTSNTAWQDHGCYKAGATIYVDWPGNSSLTGCQDDWNSLDHRDPAHPVRNILKAMYEMRTNYPVLNDGFFVEKLSNQTHEVTLPGSFGTPTELGLWSVIRSRWPDYQDFSGQGQGNQSVWILYSNLGNDTTYTFDCSINDTALLSPFDEGTTVKNLFYPYEEFTLETSPAQLRFEGSTKSNGCLETIKMPPYGFKALVPAEKWVQPAPVITGFLPGHDQRILWNGTSGSTETLSIELHFSQEMDCQNVQDSITFNSTTEAGSTISLDKNSVHCQTVDSSPSDSKYIGEVPTNWTFTANLQNVAEGIHQVTVSNVTAKSGNASTNSVDHFLLRLGKEDNPMVFQRTGNYSKTLLNKNTDGSLYISHTAPGADKFRYSTNFESSWSDWQDYKSGKTQVQFQPWNGTKKQEWSGNHIEVQYWSQLSGSSVHLQHGDIYDDNSDHPPRRFPHFFVLGSFNEFGFDQGLPSTMKQDKDGIWTFDFVSEFPSKFIANVWGTDKDGKPDLTRALGDVDNDTVLDLLAPVTLEENVVFVETRPPSPHVAYRVSLNDGSLRYTLAPIGSRWTQVAVFFLLAMIPAVTGALAVYLYLHIFYGVKFNVQGFTIKRSLLPDNVRQKLHLDTPGSGPVMAFGKDSSRSAVGGIRDSIAGVFGGSTEHSSTALRGGRNILIATMEYFIEDWGIEVKIGGLGVMARLMAKNLTHQRLIWVVPCLGGIDYPVDEQAEPMLITVFNSEYSVEIQYHHFQSITYVLLDAPVFRAQTKAEPYPKRMDDFDSAVYYSAWNSCIAEVMRRFPQIDLYHINDYHGALAPLHLLPQVVPCCLSLHNAEFQGLWPIRTPQEMNETCGIFNLDPEIVRRYVQFGEVFNLLHAGASYLRIHQKGFGAVGVSAKYGKRSFARYPIFWGLRKIGSLPNPDPTDTGETLENAASNPDFEANRAAFKLKAQEWAHLDVNPNAELFCFVGRWSEQKGIDLIADVFPNVMKQYPNAQLICIGPVIDLYGKFAAVKLAKLMSMYPGRVFSKPEFTQIPPYVFAGTDFALIPSRDEPYGLVAVEFGRKGALCVGAKVGGLGSMPGWWYTIESTTTRHLLDQFKKAIQGALESKPDVRAAMRKQATTQRFPVRQWKERLAVLQETSIKISQEQLRKSRKSHISGISTQSGGFGLNLLPGNLTPTRPGTSGATTPTFQPSAVSTRAPSPSGVEAPPQADNVPLSLGRPMGPGHAPERPVEEERGRSRSRNRLSKIRRSRASSVTSQAPAQPANNEPLNAPEFPQNKHTSWGSAATFNMMNRTMPEGMPHPPMYDDEDAASNFVDEYYLTSDFADRALKENELNALRGPSAPFAREGAGRRDSDSQPGTPGTAPLSAEDRLLPPSANRDLPPMPQWPHAVYGNPAASSSNLSLDHVAHGKKDYKLQNHEPDFTDPTELYFHNFEKLLDSLNEKTSEGALCIEDYLKKSERQWYSRYHEAKLGKVPLDKLDKTGDRSSSVLRGSNPGTPAFDTPAPSIYDDGFGEEPRSEDGMNEFLLQANYVPPTGLKKLLLQKFGDWPVYSFVLAVGQVIAANSYQIVLLTGEVGQPAEKLYIIAAIYGLTSILWWLMYRMFKSLYVVTVPWFFYGAAFFFLGLSPVASSEGGRGWVQNVATACYAIASSSGSFFFALNFGSEGSVPVKVWTFRACVIQGTQQIYVVLLWFWGARLTKSSSNSVTATTPFGYGPGYSATTIVIAVLLWAVGVVLFLGLPEYYHQAPGSVPSFYKSIMRRKIILWFFVVVLVQNFFLSAPYGRNWKYLWSSHLAPAWAVAILVVVFFIGIWAAFLYAFSKLSRSHSWILPIFAVGLGAPRWCQMLWGTSGIGENVAFAGSSTAGALLGRTLWLWLGTLDALQGVGFGMILLQTLTRFHVVFTLVSAQALGSLATIVARAAAPDKDGPGAIFPNLSVHPDGLKNVWFWIGLILQLVLCVGFFKFFRKEQLGKA